MKKVLSVFLAVLMMFSVMGVLAHADNEPTDGVVVELSLNGCTLKQKAYVVIDPDNPVIQEMAADAVPPTFYWAENATNYKYAPGHKISLPSVNVPERQEFKGWQEYTIKNNKRVLGGLYSDGVNAYVIPEGVDAVYFLATYGEDTTKSEVLERVLSILTTVFGIIIGLFNGFKFDEGIADAGKIISNFTNLF